MNTSVSNYFINGCGRCPLGATPDCKVHRWTNELQLLRDLVNESGLTEECKWGSPCYTFQDKNVLMIAAFKEHCSISFFKGSLIKDPELLLEKPGPNSQAGRLLKFKSVTEIESIVSDIRNFIQESIEIEKAGLTVKFDKTPEPIPVELENRFDEDPTFKNAFESLSPGRQRGYILHFSQPKQSKTRIARIEKFIPMILSGIGMHDNYKSRKK